MKNKEITIYELMGLIKDDEAPKKIKIDNEIYTYKKDYEHADYFVKDSNIELNYNYYVEYNKLNEKIVEILPEENDKWEDIEELNNNFTFEDTICELTDNDYKISCLSKKINKLIKNQQKIIEKLEGKQNEKFI